MGINKRNEIGVSGGGVKLSAMESSFNDKDGIMRKVQPFGVLDGRYDHVDTQELLGRLGTQWISTVVDGGTDTADVKAVQVAVAGLGPHLKFTTNDADNDSNQIQYARAITAASTTLTAAGGAIFIPGAGYDIVFKMRFRVTTTVANCCLLFGLPIVDTTLVATGAIGVTEMIGFTKADATASMLGNMRVGSSSTTVTAGTVVINTWHTIEMRLNGVSTIEYRFDGVRTGSSTMTNIPTAVLCPSIAIGTTAAAVATMDCDSFFVGKEMR